MPLRGSNPLELPYCNAEWERSLEEYMRYRPDTKVIDRVDGIRTLQNRATMLHPLKGVGICFKVGDETGCRAMQRRVVGCAPSARSAPRGRQGAHSDHNTACKLS